jgi:hypothetical protein
MESTENWLHESPDRKDTILDKVALEIAVGESL